METPTKVIFCTDGVFPHTVGGIQRHTQLLVEELAKLGTIDIIVIHPHTGIRVFEAFPRVKEIVPAYTSKGRHYFVELYRYSKVVFDIIQQYPDYLVYSQGLVVWHGAAELRKRLIINPHGLEAFQTLGFVPNLKVTPFRLVQQYQFRRAAGVISLGGKLTDVLRRTMGKRADRLAIIPNAIPAPPPTIPEKQYGHVGPTRVLFVGRIAYNKGINVLLEAARLLDEAGMSADFIFTIAGKGPLYETYKAQNLLANVQFLGFVGDKDLFDLYIAHDLFLLPTLFEGMPTVVLEAMAAGMPVAVTDVGATRELVDAENGYIIETGNPHSIASALRDFRTLPTDQVEALRQASYTKVQTRFTWAQVALQHVALFRKILSANKP